MGRAAILVLCAVACFTVGESVSANPIRKVVTKLQDMQKEVVAEGEKEQKLYDAFMCQCKSGAGALEESIKTGLAQVDALTGKLETEAAQKSQLEQDITQHKADSAAAEAAVKEATAMRGKEAAEFAASSGEMKSNIEAMKGALAALKKGLSASMLQTGVGQTLRSIIANSPAVSELERGSLTEFLETGEGGSDQIIGIVSTMLETMEADLKESVAAEESAKESFTSLESSKTAEVSAAQKAVEGKTARVGELAVSLVQAKADLANTEDAVKDDEAMKANLETSCKTKTAEFDELSKTRATEVQAISETIEMLSGDEALELFKKTLPSAPALLQVSMKKLATSEPKFLMLQTHHKAGMKNVIEGIIDKLMKTNAAKQAADDKQHAFCVKELEATEADVKALKTEVADGKADVPQREDVVAGLTGEIDALKQGLLDLDKSVAEATEQRKAEHAEYLQSAQMNQAAKELIGMAKNRLAKFYSPSQYKAPASTAAPALMQYKKSEGGGSVMSMMDSIMGDIDLEVQEAKHDEESAQKDYEEAMKDAVAKRSADSKMIVEKTDAKATEETNLENAKAQLRTSEKMLREAEQKASYTHGMCDQFLKDFEDKKASRESQNKMLAENKAVLHDVKPVFLQRH